MSVSNRWFGLMSAALALVVLVGCSGKSNPSNGGSVTYALTAVASPADGGEVSLDPDRAQYDAGTEVTATAAPKAGYEFAGWTGASTSKDAVVTVTMNGDKALTANFKKNGVTSPSYTLTTNVSPSDGGSVLRSPNKTNYKVGEKVTLRVTPNSGYELAGWSGAFTSKDTAVTFIMDADKEITANFARLYFLNVDDYVNCSPDRSNHAYPAGMQVTLTAADRPGFTFAGWSGVSSTNSTVTITMDAKDMTVTANYTRNKYELNVDITPDSGGTVSPPSGTTYYYRMSATVTATPNDGYGFAGWSGTSSSELTSVTNPEVTITMNGDKTLIANFERLYTLTVSATSGGRVSYAPNQENYRAGTQVTVTATPNTLYRFVRWKIISGWPSETPMPQLNNATITFPVNADIILTAEFQLSLLSQPPDAGE